MMIRIGLPSALKNSALNLFGVWFMVVLPLICVCLYIRIYGYWNIAWFLYRCKSLAQLLPKGKSDEFLMSSSTGEEDSMLPIGDDNSGRRIIPFVTYALIAVNVLVYFLIELRAPDIEAFILTYGAIPKLLLQGEGIGTLVTSMFLHDPSSLLHLLSNMLFLWIFGDNIEDSFGHVLYLIFYFICGIVANLAQVLVSPSS
jgi:hypothetical protein